MRNIESNIVNYIRVKRLAWAGHLMHMNNDKTFFKKINTKQGGVRRFGRPKLRRWRWSRYENIRGQEFEEGRPRQR